MRDDDLAAYFWICWEKAMLGARLSKTLQPPRFFIDGFRMALERNCFCLVIGDRSKCEA
ncbi:hypothetical protein EAW52_25385 [Pseudomonas sp. LTJR-52]|nr:hypothetical protein EAW52_25385 [Pseudomonas sp. LTJR-52]